MSSGPSVPVQPEPVQPQRSKASLYSSASDGLRQVQQDFLYWTGRLTDSGFQLSLALIAGNWAAFGSLQKILNNSWAKWSLALVIATLALSLLGAYIMGHLHQRQIEYAAEDPARWEEDCKRSFGKVDPWPYTDGIETLGRWTREVKTWLPLVSGVCFLVALFTA